MALAEATRLTQPLPGGQEGATVSFRPLNSAYMRGPLEPMAMTGGKLKAIRSIRGDRSGWLRFPVPAFLVEHPGVGLVLVDTGLHASVAVDPKQNLGPVLGRLYVIEMEPEQAVAAQLRALGLAPGDVKVVVMTHMHMDHSSAISDFTEATYVLGEGEWDAFSAPRSTFHGYVKKHAAVAVEFREVVYDTRLVGSYSSFGRSFDLFGDGSVRLVYTPGHSRGHQSVILRLKGREALLAGDAVYSLATLDHERRGLFLDDEHTWRRSLREVQLYCRENPEALVIASHDHERWPDLEQRYE
jgi:glyoxylase-like metal-dependent hydrolase (beta-lactamase superfamily II)